MSRPGLVVRLGGSGGDEAVAEGAARAGLRRAARCQAIFMNVHESQVVHEVEL